MQSVSTTDEELMARYQAGDPAAFSELFTRHRDRVYGFLTQQIRDPDRAADLFQETFLRLHESRGRYDRERPFAPWLFRICRNLVSNEHRRSGRSKEAVTAPEELDQAATQTAAHDVLETSQMHDQLRAALVCLPSEQQEAISLSFFAGLKYSQIADVAGATEDAIKQRVRRGLAALRNRLQPLSGDEPT